MRAAFVTEEGDLESSSAEWPVLLPEQKLDMDKQHEFTAELNAVGSVSHVRMSIYPDGGVSRLRLFGRALQP